MYRLDGRWRRVTISPLSSSLASSRRAAPEPVPASRISSDALKTPLGLPEKHAQDTLLCLGEQRTRSIVDETTDRSGHEANQVPS
jgi:hypothetical protein